jgi:hypothetical protein
MSDASRGIPSRSGGEPADAPARPCDAAGGERGFVLVTVLLVLILLSGLVAVALLMSRAEVQIGGNDYTATRAFYAAEAGTETMLAAVREKLSDGVITPSEVDEVDDDPPDIPGFDLATYEAEMTSSTADVVEITQGPFAGLKSLSRELLLTSTTEGPSGARTTVELSADALAIPIFQFASFYNEDLEVFPGPVMDLTGRVHTNEHLYLGSENDLNLHDVVTAAGHLHFHRKYDPAVSPGGDVNIELNDGSWFEMAQDVHVFCGGSDPDPGCSDAQAENFVDYAQSTWDDNVQTAAHGVQALRLPVPEGTDPYELVVPCDEISEPSMEEIAYGCPGNWDVRIEATGASVDVDDGGLGWDGDEVEFAVDQFYDDREQDCAMTGGASCPPGTTASNETSDRDVIELDLSEVDASEYAGLGGDDGTIIYVTADLVPGTPATQRQTVLRVRNGERLEGPLTIATDLPLYVLGDFNSDPDWQPASLVSDNVTFLSETWASAPDSRDDDVGENSKPTASDTEVYAAILSGHTPTTDPGAASAEEGGQFENFPRFLEDWSPATMTIVGSFVSLWYDRWSDSEWQWCCTGYSENYYQPPTRDWSFDERFENPDNLPPGTPVVGQILKIGFIRTY